MLALGFSSELSSLRAQGTAFTYQGRLNASGNPVTGLYDLRFYLRDAPTGGVPVGVTNTLTSVPVSNGLFTVTLNFGGVFDGTALWLGIAVRTNGAGSYTTMGPLQSLTPAPYAITAANLSGGVSSAQLPLAGTSASAPGAVYVDNNTISVGTDGQISVNGSALTSLNAGALSGGVGFVRLAGPDLQPGDTSPGTPATVSPSAGPSYSAFQVSTIALNNVKAQFVMPFDWDGGPVDFSAKFCGGTSGSGSRTLVASFSASAFGAALGGALQATNTVSGATDWSSDLYVTGMTIAGAPAPGALVTVNVAVWGGIAPFSFANTLYLGAITMRYHKSNIANTSLPWVVSDPANTNTNSNTNYFEAQNFNGGNTAPDGNWVLATAPATWNYATSPAPLEGTGSLALTGSGATVDLNTPIVPEVWVYFRFAYHGALTNVQDDVFDSYALQQGNWPANGGGRVFLLGGGNMGIEFENVSGSAGTMDSGMDPDTPYHVWIHFRIGTGNNESGSVGWTKDTGPGSAIEPTSGTRFASISNGKQTAGYDQLEWYITPPSGGKQNGGLKLIYDTVRVSFTGDIGNNPQ